MHVCTCTYEQRIIEIEHGSFMPLVLSATGGMGQAVAVAYKRMASLLAEKKGNPTAGPCAGFGVY